MERIGDPETVKKTEGCDGWIDRLFHNGDCTITAKIRFKAVLDLYMCTAQDLDLSQFTCPASATVYLGQRSTKEHNVAVARVPGWNDPKTGDLVIGNSGFNGHSKIVILEKLEAKGFQPSQITALYTERQPCPDCASALAGALKAGTPVTYSVPYHPDYWKSAKKLLAKYIAKAGGGRAMRSLTGEQQTEERGVHD
jgi:hypothetical protein